MNQLNQTWYKTKQTKNKNKRTKEQKTKTNKQTNKKKILVTYINEILTKQGPVM